MSEIVKLKEVAKLQGGYAFKSQDFISNKIPVIRIGNISDNKVTIDYDVTVDNKGIISEHPEFIIKKDDILIAMSGATVGKIGIYDKENISLLNQRVGKFVTNERVNSKYLYYVLQSELFRKYILNNAFGCAQPNISGNQIEEFEFKIYSILQQNEIIDQLDRISKVIELKKKQLNDLDNIIKSQFVELFGDPILNNKNWKTDELNNVAPSKPYKGELDNKVWLLNLDMVESQSGRIIDYVYEDIGNVGNSTCRFSEENVLYSKLRPYLNKVVIPDKKGIATSELIPLLPQKNILERYFLAYLLRSEEFVKYISEKVAGAKMPRVSMDIFRSFKVILPPIELQNKFAEFVKLIDKQKFEIEKSLKEMQELYESLMDKYFG